jgi:hypothetical protein
MKEILKTSEVKMPKVQGGRTNTPPSFQLKPIIIKTPATPTDKK